MIPETPKLAPQVEKEEKQAQDLTYQDSIKDVENTQKML